MTSLPDSIVPTAPRARGEHAAPSGPTADALSAEFPSLERWTYVNHAAVSPWPTRTVRAVEGFARANHRDGPDSFPYWLANEQALRDRMARLLCAASAAEISLVPNTTEGINIVAHGLDWQDGDNLVTAQDEFPTNQLAWRALEARGVACRTVDLDAEDDPEQALIDALDERTRVLTVSGVRWTDGLRLDLGRLGAACRAAGVLFFVDAIQQFGALRIDVQSELIDCLAAGGHKWQMAPEGLGVFYCRDAWRERIAPLKEGWRMLESPFAFETPGRGIQAGGQRFEPGSPSSMSQFALNASLSLQEDWGQAWIEQRILANTDRLLRGLKSLPGVRVLGRGEPSRRSGIVCFTHRAHRPEALAEALAERRVVTIPRAGGIRLSPHAYQGEAIVEATLDAVEACLKKV